MDMKVSYSAWIRASVATPRKEALYLATVMDVSHERHVIISQFNPGVGWSNLNPGEKVIAWMDLPEADRGGDPRIERKDGRVYYVDKWGNRYIIYLLVDLEDQLVIHSKPFHYMAVAVEDEDGGKPCGHFYIEGLDDESLLSCCKTYVSRWHEDEF